MEASDAETERAAQAFRPNRRPLFYAFLANGLLAALCLGLPYYRGRLQAQRAMSGFSSFAACLLGGRAQSGLGLGLPRGERAQFAAQVMRASADWPARCRKPLRAIAPEEAIFLWPSVKQAGADVRAVVAFLDQELQQLARSRQVERGRVPERPLLALSKLQAGLTLLAQAAGTNAAIDEDAVRFPKDGGLVEPARLPLTAGQTAALQVWAGRDGLHALAMDGRGLSWLRVEDGKLDRKRIRRTSLVRAVLRGADVPVIVWAMPKDRCAKEDDRCARHASGVARFDEQSERLPDPFWLGGHPANRPDRSVRIAADGSVELLALRDPEGNLELRRYAVNLLAKQPAVRSEDDAAPAPLPPSQRIAVPTELPPSDALLLPGTPRAAAYLVTDPSGAQNAFVASFEPGAAPIALGAVRGEGSWLAACELAGARAVVFGTNEELAVTRVEAAGNAVPLLAAAPIALGTVLHGEDPARDRVRLLCGGDALTLVAVNQAGVLSTLRCSADRCQQGVELSHDVTAFDALSVATGAQSSTLVAYSRLRKPWLVVAELDERGTPRRKPETPAACWDPISGMCGQPTLVADTGRLLLCTRDGGDLLAIESDDGGKRWKPMSGLKVAGAINTDVNAPMDQHRIRKGLE